MGLALVLAFREARQRRCVELMKRLCRDESAYVFDRTVKRLVQLAILVEFVVIYSSLSLITPESLSMTNLDDDGNGLKLNLTTRGERD